MKLAQRIHNGSRRAVKRLHERLATVGVYAKTRFDEYDNSIELDALAPDFRLSDRAQKLLAEAGFATVYCNHRDGWETHYRVVYGPGPGWRVSYPHHRRDGGPGIWVESKVNGWPEDWFESGKAVVVPPPRAKVTP